MGDWLNSLKSLFGLHDQHSPVNQYNSGGPRPFQTPQIGVTSSMGLLDRGDNKSSYFDPHGNVVGPGMPKPKSNLPNLTPMEKATMETFKQYGIPWQVAYGIAGGENGHINHFNLGAVDSNPNAAVPFASALHEATAAARFLSGQADTSFYGNKAAGKQAFLNAYSKRQDPAAMLQAVRDAGYAGDPVTWKQRSIDAGGAGRDFDTWDSFIKATPAWKKWDGNY